MGQVSRAFLRIRVDVVGFIPHDSRRRNRVEPHSTDGAVTSATRSWNRTITLLVAGATMLLATTLAPGATHSGAHPVDPGTGAPTLSATSAQSPSQLLTTGVPTTSPGSSSTGVGIPGLVNGTPSANVPPALLAPGMTLAPNSMVVSPPASIDTTCAVDDTPGLLRWFATLPAGTATHPLEVVFGEGDCYQIDGSLFFHNVQRAIFNGNGAKFVQLAPRSEMLVTTSNDQPYCGSPATFGPNPGHIQYQLTIPIMWWFDGGCDLTIENMTILGSYPGVGGGGVNMQDSAMQFNGVQRATITNNIIRHAWGDFVTISGLHEAPGGGGGMPATDIVVRNNSMSDSGRQGITTIYVDRVLISGNVMDRIAATMFDIESPVAGGSSDNITITGNVCPFGMYAYVVAAYTLSPIHNFAFTDNRLGSQGQMRIEMHPPSGSNFTFTGNIAGAVNSAQDGVRSAITVTGVVDTVRVTGNVIPTAPWNHGSPTLEGAPAVSTGPYVVKVQVSSNYLPVAYQFGEPHTFTQVLPLFSGAAPPQLSSGSSACGNLQGPSGGSFYSGPCRARGLPPPLPFPASPPLP